MEREQWERTNANAFMEHNFVEVAARERDWAAVTLDIRPESRNPYGYVHGGAFYAMADNAAGLAAHSDGRSYVTRGSSLHFVRNQKTGTLRAEGRVLSRGRRACLVDVEITGEGGALLAAGTFDYFCVDDTVRPDLRRDT